MIIAYDDCVNSDIDQAYYDELSNSLRIEAVKCSACKQVGFKVHRYYSRHMKRELYEEQANDRILIKRVICKKRKKYGDNTIKKYRDIRSTRGKN